MQDLSWVEISEKALAQNMRQFRELVGANVILCPCVKANAYGHGLALAGKIFLDNGADWLSVNALYEAKVLREAGIESPIYLMGYTAMKDLSGILEYELQTVVYNREIVMALGELASKKGGKVKVHIKVETGNNRQGVLMEDLVDFAKYIQGFEGLEIEGLATHFANIEDTTDHSYAEKQLNKFKEAVSLLQIAGIEIPIKHCANSAATILFPKTHFDMVRTGISAYGMWPSNETYVSYVKERRDGFELQPAFCWKTRIAQIKEIPEGEYIGYGCTYKTTRRTRLGVLPIGYYDGYDRCMNGAHVLINGKRAKVCGRVCMNILMVDLTDIPEAKVEDEVVLMGRDKDEEINAEQFATWASTINYEVTTRVNDRIPRVIV
jgi:alanine racemase